jgi:DNA-binding CsgD family transcriptional regulator
MRIGNNQHDTSHELHISKHGNGIKLARSRKETNQENHFPDPYAQPTILNIFKLPCNVYFLDMDSCYKNTNELSAEICFSTSVKSAIGKSMRDIASVEDVERILKNDTAVMRTGKIIIIEEEIKRENMFDLHGLSIKLLWYGEENNIIGALGFSIISNLQSLTESLLPIAQLGFLCPTLPNQILSDRFEVDNIRLSKRETDIARLIVQKKTAKETAKILGLSYRTVESYIENIKVKTNAYSKSELIDKIAKNGESLYGTL